MELTVKKIKGEVCTVIKHDGSEKVILPALPRYPSPLDAKLLYRYAAEGLIPVFEMSSELTAAEHDGPFVYEPFVGVSYREDRYIKIMTEYRAFWFDRTTNKEPQYAGFPAKIVHALYDGEKVEIAIKDQQP